MGFIKNNLNNIIKIAILALIGAVVLFLVAYLTESDKGLDSLKITNLSANSVSVSWTTTDATVASVQYSQSNNWIALVDKVFPKDQAFDDRDLITTDDGKLEYSSIKAYPRYVHHVTIRNLDASTQYYFRINGNLRTFVPSENSFTTLNQATAAGDPDPVYGKVINYATEGDDPVDGIVYFRVVDKNNPDNESQLYSSIIGLDSGWAGDMNRILDKNNNKFNWDKNNFRIDIEAITPEGTGDGRLSLESYKPVENTYVNIAYALDSQVEGASTNSSNPQLGVKTVYAGSAIVNGVPVCLSPYSEACGDGCNRQVNCGSNKEFRPQACVCAGEDPKKNETSPTKPTCPIATVYDPGTKKCIGTTKKLPDATTDQDATVGGGDKVADKKAKPNDPKTRAEANAVLAGGKKKSSGAKATTGVLLPPSCKKANDTTIHKNDNQIINNAHCDACVNVGTKMKDPTTGILYVCNDPDIGWVKESTTKTCTTIPSCPTLSCGASASSKATVTPDGRVMCAYSPSNSGSIVIPIGTCSNGEFSNSFSDSDLELKVCKVKIEDSCAAQLANVTCPNQIRCTQNNISSSDITLNSTNKGAADVSCNYSYQGASLYSFPYASCTDNIVTTNDIESQVCNAAATQAYYLNISVEPTNTNTTITSQTCTDNNCQDSTNGGDSAQVTCRDKLSPYVNQLNCPAPPSCSQGSYSPGTKTLGDNSITCTYGVASGNLQPITKPIASCDDSTLQVTVNTRVRMSCVTADSGPLSPVKKVYAQPVPEVLDPNELSKGTYSISIPGYKNAEVAILNNNVQMKYFQDLNGDGIKQDNEPYIDPSTYQVSVAKLSDLTTYNFKAGWNLFALNFISSDFPTASSLVAEINRQGVGAVQLAKYDNGAWIYFVYRINDSGDVQTYGNDFTLVPGEGYFLRALNPGVISLKGQKFQSSVPINLNKGWNLASVQSSIDYTALSFINKCESQSVQCTTVSRLSNGIYESVVKSGQKIFGNDFSLLNTEGYFILNKSENKTISP